MLLEVYSSTDVLLHGIADVVQERSAVEEATTNKGNECASF